MLVGGLQPFTLSDYPGHVAATVFTQGCDWRCPFCHNPGLLPLRPPDGRACVPLDELWQRLPPCRGRLHGVVVSGGEPTIHDDLAAFLARIRGFGLPVKLDTNGSRPDRLAVLLEAKLVDYVAMDVKAALDDASYRRLAGVPVDVSAIRRSIDLIAGSGVEHEFRTTVVPGLHESADILAIRAELPAGSVHRLQRMRPVRS